MATNNIDDIYSKIISLENLYLAYKKARRYKTKKDYVIEFEKNLIQNILKLHHELKDFTYFPQPLKTFILRDPKTRKISKSAFRDRVVHHAIFRVIEPIFDKSFIYDSCANRIGKGNLFALKRFDEFKRQVSRNNTRASFVLKADIKHYFEEVDHEVLINLLRRKIKDEKVIELIIKILNNGTENGRSMPLGNLTSQFFANVYLNELDYFIKQILHVKYYIRYVDDFVILHESKEQLEEWKLEIENFLSERLKLELHPQKSKIIPLFQGVDFVGFRNFYNFKLLRKRNLRKFILKLKQYENGELNYEKLMESFQGWNAYAKWASSYKLRRRVLIEISKIRNRLLFLDYISKSIIQ